MANMQNMNKDTALRLAEELDDGYPLTGDAISAAAELRSQHARIAELEAQLSAIGAGGVSLLIAQQHSTAHSALPEGWVPCTIAFDGDAEDVAYGPKPMMDRLAKWLGKHFERVVAEKNAAQQSAPSPAPAGWKLVPVEPTEGMLKAADDGDDAYTLRCFGPDVQRVMQGPYDHYCAMLDAAPTAQADTQPAQQGVSYAALPESFLEIPDVQDESGINAYYSREVVLECIDAALASHGQAPAGATKPTEQQILEAAEKAGLWPNTVHSWIPAFHRYHKELAKAQSAPAQAAEPVAVVVPCYTPSGKRVALCSAKQDLPIGTKLYAAPQPSPTAPATQQPEGDVVAYLDVGANGYLDLGSELSEDALQQLPKGRHALVIAGTYGIDGYVAAPQPSYTAQAADSVQEDAARYRWLREGNDAKHGAAWHVAVNLYGCEWDAAIDAAMNKGGAA